MLRALWDWSSSSFVLSMPGKISSAGKYVLFYLLLLNFLILSLPQYPFIQQHPGKQADADRGGRRVRWRGCGWRGWYPQGCWQWRGECHLQLLLFPFPPLSGLSVHHDDSYQLVQVSTHSRLTDMKQQVRYETFDPDGEFKIHNFHLYQLLTYSYLWSRHSSSGAPW